MKPYTVLLLRPARQREDDAHPSDWVYRAWVEADNPDDAEVAACEKLARGDEDVEPAEPFEVATLAIYEGHLFDLYLP
jgi:hypothetical protein